jgi:microcystin-dependent protein
MTLYKWSQTSASDATADSTINWQEGQAPSTVNDSARAMMAATAKYRDDIAGAIVTGGNSTAYTVSSYQVFDTLAHLGGQTIAFTPHTTNGATVTLNVDSLGAKPLRTSPGAELLAGTIIQGTPYVAVYNNSDAVFYLQGFFGNPYYIPLGAGLDFWGSTTPNNSFAFPTGQAISRLTYSSLFSLVGTTYGSGDGSTTFNLPDKTGRVSAMKEAITARLTSYFGGNSTSLGAVGGAESLTLSTSQIPSHTHSGTTGTESITHTHSGAQAASQNGAGGTNGGFTESWFGSAQSTGTESATHTHNFTTDGGTVGGVAHRTVQPTIICNYILRII